MKNKKRTAMKCLKLVVPRLKTAKETIDEWDYFTVTLILECMDIIDSAATGFDYAEKLWIIGTAVYYLDENMTLSLDEMHPFCIGGLKYSVFFRAGMRYQKKLPIN